MITSSLGFIEGMLFGMNRTALDGANFTTECGAMFFWEPPTPLHCPCCGGRVKVVR